MHCYNYIVVGGGSAGCTLAARLSEVPDCSVLLLEAGGSGTTFFHRMPAANGFMFNRPRFDWGFYSEPQAELNGRRIYYPRGKGLGGSSNLNGMIYIRGNARDYDLWRQEGLDGWGYADVLPYFLRSEGSWRGGGPHHGASGPLRTSRTTNFGEMDRAFVDAAVSSGLPPNDDFNGAAQYGAGQIDVTVHQGRRMSTAETYLKQARKRPNLTVREQAHVHRITFEQARASGVRFERNGKVATVGANREVLVCLGAFGSPQLLMLSGIGNAAALDRLGIPTVADLPGVGENLQDHPDIFVQRVGLKPELSLARYQKLLPALGLGLNYLLRGKGPGASPFWGAIAFASRGDDTEHPDYQIFLTPMILVENPQARLNKAFREPWCDTSRLGRALFVRGKTAAAGFQLDINLMRPRSRGRVFLGSSDPRDPVRIDPNYLSDPDDRAAFVEAVHLARDIFSQDAFDGLAGEELVPGPSVSRDEQILSFVRDNATTGHHPVGTCKMAPDHDPMAVVDSSLKVRGVEGLRVVDASIKPNIVTGNTNAPVIMIAEKAADMIRNLEPLPRAEV
jgi:choline dehydrogenase